MNTALHYGVGVFEGIRCYQTERGPAIFRLAEHMERLVNSAMVLGFRVAALHGRRAEVAARQVVKANGFGDCYIRPLIYRQRHAALAQPGCRNVASVGIAAWEWGAYLGEEAREKGVRANVSSFTRHHPNVMHDQGQDHRQLCQQHPGQDRIDPPGL